MSSHFTKFKTLWDEFTNYQPFTTCTCGFKQSQMEAQYKEFFFFLTILNDSYGNLTSQILLAEPLPSINKVRSLILQEEKRSIGHEVNVVYPVEATAMYANTRYNAKAHQG